jgi:DNA-binding PadR family transcriptional regulator
MSVLSTKHVVLGLVIERPSYGYDLQQRFNTRFRFLSLSEKVTYRVLDTLKAEGWIEPVGVKQVGKTERGAPCVIYGATERGRRVQSVACRAVRDRDRARGGPCQGRARAAAELAARDRRNPCRRRM